ncbi:MAG: hypothetical protein IMZ65_01945 [Planctomycetes bacterium]|nr:hypothetical protein [Planctomycetota bacterium]
MEVRVYEIVGGDHTWYTKEDVTDDTGAYNPQLRLDFPSAAPPKGDGHTPDIVWGFLSRHRRLSGTTDASRPAGQVRQQP